jgi:hypothetical protein
MDNPPTALWALNDHPNRNLVRNYMWTDGSGPELVTNGGFDTDTVWTKGTGWTIAAGVASHAAGTASSLYQSVPSLNGLTVEIAFTVSNYVAGTIRGVATNSGVGTYVSGNGTYAQRMIGGASGSTIAGVNANSAFIGDVDNVSIRQVGQYDAEPVAVTPQDALGPGGVGSVYLHDGATTFIDIYKALIAMGFNPADKFTLSLWVKPFNAAFWTDGVQQTFIEIGANGSSNFMNMRNPTNAGRLNWYYEAGNLTAQRSLDGNSGVDWFRMDMTVSVPDNRVRAFKNGVQAGADFAGFGVWAGALATNLCLIGGATTTPLAPHYGWLSLVGVWPGVELTPAEIAAMPGVFHGA